MTLPMNRTNLTAYQTNAEPNKVFASTVAKTTMKDAFDGIDELNAKVDSTLQGIYDAGKFSKLGIINVKDFGAKGDGATDDTAAIQAAINAIPSTGGFILFPGSTYKITGTIFLKSNVTLASFDNMAKIQGVGVEEMLKTNGTGTYTNICITGLIIDAGKANGDNMIRVCAQLYNVTNLRIINSIFRHGSAAIGLDTCEDVWIEHNLIEGMYQQTNAAAVSPGVYGYGVVVNESNNVYIENNIIGSEKPLSDAAWIDRHAVYVSNHGTAQAINSSRVFVRHNSIVMKTYTTDADTVTNFEYALKSIGGNFIEFEQNTVINGAGGVLLAYNYLNGVSIKIAHNHFIDILKRGVWVLEQIANPGAVSFENVIIRDNYFKIKGTYAIGVSWKNVKDMQIEDNVFIATDTASTSPCLSAYTLTDGNTVPATLIRSRGNRIKGFQRVGYINNVTNFESDEYVESISTPGTPYEFIESVTNKKMKIKNMTPYAYKTQTTAGLAGLTYFDEDFGYDIRCVQANPSIWKDAADKQVVGTASTRPNIATIPVGFKFWEQDQNRFVYWTGFDWSTNNTIVPAYGTKAEILAINGGSSYSNNFIYNTDDKKPYWWDPVATKWKDSAGTILV